MKADTLSLQHALQGDRRFVVPVYQRPYVWDQEKQWEPLWNDVESTALRLAKARVDGKNRNLSAAEADKTAPPHFLGAIVLEQHPTATGDLDVRLVVDGQQRLATLQLMLRGVLDSLIEIGVKGPSIAKLLKLTLNDEDVVSGDDRHKVWPRLAEKEEYFNAMGPRPVDDADSIFSSARDFFAESARDFLSDDQIEHDPFSEGEPEHQRASLLVATLLGLVKVVVIDLEDVDDAQVIFEALNARNTPLSATDLVKNLLFMRARAQHLDPAELYDQVWQRFDVDEKWWREPVGVGHAQRARQDWLVGDWLISEVSRVINVGRLYGEFRSWLDESGVQPTEAFKTLNQYADGYEVLAGKEPGATRMEMRAFKSIETLNITATNPVLLWLLVQPPEVLLPVERELAIRAIESFLVRRMAIKWQTRAYGHVFVEVLEAARKTEESPGKAVVKCLESGPHGYDWPTDEKLLEYFEKGRFYGPGGISQGRLRLILGAIDSLLQSKSQKSEPGSITYDELQVEHLIPQDWRKRWHIKTEDSSERFYLEQERDSHIHRIGNLTLVSDRLNPALSNDPWSEKREELSKHSKLILNSLLCENDDWSERKIANRGRWIAKEFSKVWPGPSDKAWMP